MEKSADKMVKRGQLKRRTTLHPNVRLSLFPNVPPYVRFSNAKLKLMPFAVRKVMLWKYSKITPYIVRKILANTGYQLLDESMAWSGTWANQTKSTMYRKLQSYQKFNHLPGTVEIGRKDLLWKSIQRMIWKHGARKFDIMPVTFVLPQERKSFQTEWEKNGAKEQCWIIKPPASYRGDGIRIVRKYKQVPYCTPIVAQKYVHNPYLINDTKFDLRLYVLMTSANPLRIYWHENGLVRFASTKYSTDQKTFGNRYVHLTNYSVNKLNEKYVINPDANACVGHKWTVKTLWRYLENERQVDVNQLRHRLTDLIIKTMICGENAITKSVTEHLHSRYNVYELFGFDVILDSNLKPWLLEVNISPSLEVSSPLDKAVKAPLMQEILNIVGFHIPGSKKYLDEELAACLGMPPNTRLTYDSRIYSIAISYTEKHKQSSFVNKNKRSDYLNSILETLTPDDLRQLITYEDEVTQLKSFQKIFPTPSSHQYFRYFEKQRYYNLLLDAWEHKYHKNREKGWEVLRSYCEKGVHLRTARRFIKKT